MGHRKAEAEITSPRLTLWGLRSRRDKAIDQDHDLRQPQPDTCPNPRVRMDTKREISKCSGFNRSEQGLHDVRKDKAEESRAKSHLFGAQVANVHVVGIIPSHFGINSGGRDELKVQAEDPFRKSQKGHDRTPAPPVSPWNWFTGLVLIHSCLVGPFRSRIRIEVQAKTSIYYLLLSSCTSGSRS